MRVSLSNAPAFKQGGDTYPAASRAREMQGMLRRWESNGGTTRAGKMNSKYVSQVDFYRLEKHKGYLKSRL